MRLTILNLKWLCLPLILGGILLVFGYSLAYQAPLHYEMPINGPTGFIINGLEATERSDLVPFRWTAPQSNFRLPAFGQAAYRLHLSFHTPLTATPRTLAVHCDGHRIGHIKLTPGWQTVTLVLPPTTPAPNLTLVVDPPLRAKGRTLGIALDHLSLDQLAPAVLPAVVLRQLLVIMLLVTTIMLVAGVDRPGLTVGFGTTLAGLLLLLAWQRLTILLLLTPLTQALVAALGLAFVIRWLSRRWMHQDDGRWLVGVRLIVLSLAVARLVGLWYPTFQEVDHTLRIHQIQQIANGQQHAVADQLNNQFEWGATVQVPYSLWAYYPFVPLAHLVSAGQLKSIVEVVTAMLDASIPLVLFNILQGAGKNARMGWWAAAAYAVMPVGYLYYHDGSFPTIIGLWMTVMALLCLQRLSVQPCWRWALLSLVTLAISMLLYVTQLGFVPLLVGIYIAALWVTGGSKQRVVAKWSAGALLGGILLAFTLYYGPVLPRIVLTTVPLLWDTLRTQGSVGTLYPALSGSFLMQAWGHFRVIGLVMAAGGVILELRRRSWLGHLGLAYAGFCVLTVLVDTRFHLWNKHLYFALPGIALLGGAAFAWLDRRGTTGLWLARSILVLLMVASLHAWMARVLFYESSLRIL